MSLIQCSDCKKPVSDRASACPSCGLPNRAENARSAAAAPGGNDNFSKVLPITLRAQETRLWCWAASTEMILEFLGSEDVSQCGEASRYFSKICCPGTAPGTGCINGGWPQFSPHGFQSKRTSQVALPWHTIKEEIDNGRPIAFSWKAPFGGHMMVIVGYATNDGTNYVVVHDPLPVGIGTPNLVLPYDVYVTGRKERGETHWDDFYSIERVHGPGGNIMAESSKELAMKGSQALAEINLSAALKFSNVDPAAPGGNGDPVFLRAIPVFNIGAAELLQEQAPGGMENLIGEDTSPQSVIHPIVAGGSLTTAITTHQTTSGWQVTSFGNNNLAVLVDRVREYHSQRTGVRHEDYRVVDVSSLGLYFLLVKIADEEQMIPLADDPELGLKVGEGLPLTEMLDKLRRVARDYNGQPA